MNMRSICKVALGGFEPPSLAPKASMIGLKSKSSDALEILDFQLTATPQGCK